MDKTLDSRQHLLTSWKTLTAVYQTRDSAAEKLFKAIAQKYSHPTRHYHTLQHIEKMLAFIDARRENIENFTALAFAVWFHDLEYNTLKSDNEEKSAAFARKILLKFKAPEADVQFVEKLILATKTHELKTPSEDEKIMLDADLAILAAPREEYHEYSRNIRKEYHWVPGFMYDKKRQTILENFLARERIYRTDEMFENAEKTARENMEWEISRL